MWFNLRARSRTAWIPLLWVSTRYPHKTYIHLENTRYTHTSTSNNSSITSVEREPTRCHKWQPIVSTLYTLISKVYKTGFISKNRSWRRQRQPRGLSKRRVIGNKTGNTNNNTYMCVCACAHAKSRLGLLYKILSYNIFVYITTYIIIHSLTTLYCRREPRVRSQL